MWHQHCDHCNTDQLFGIRRVTGLRNLDSGVMEISWSCPACRSEHRFVTGVAT